MNPSVDNPPMNIKTIDYEVIVFNEFFIKEDSVSHFIEAQSDNVNLVREEQDIATGEMRFFQNTELETSMFVLGRNKKQEDLLEHVKKINERGIAQREADSVSSEPIIRFLRPLESTNGAYLRKPDTHSPYVVYYRLKINVDLAKQSIKKITSYISEIRKDDSTLLADFYSIAGEGIENEFILHEEYESELAYQQLQSENPIASGFDSWLMTVTNEDGMYEKKFLTELNRLL